MLLASVSKCDFLDYGILLGLRRPENLLLSDSRTPSKEADASLKSSLLRGTEDNDSSKASVNVSFELYAREVLLPSVDTLSDSFAGDPFPPALSDMQSEVVSPMIFVIEVSASESKFFSFV